jgi:hypothetical protein
MGDRIMMLIVDGVTEGITLSAVGGMKAIEVGKIPGVKIGSVVTATPVGTPLNVACCEPVGVSVVVGTSVSTCSGSPPRLHPARMPAKSKTRSKVNLRAVMMTLPWIAQA